MEKFLWSEFLEQLWRWSLFGVFSYSVMVDAKNTTSVTQALTIVY